MSPGLWHLLNGGRSPSFRSVPQWATGKTHSRPPSKRFNQWFNHGLTMFNLNMLAPNPTFNHTPTCPNNDMSSQISCMKGMIGIMMLHSMYNSHAFQQSQR